MSDPLCPSCGSCGFPMREREDFAGGRLDAPFCSTCGDATGALKPYADVLQANAAYLVSSQGLDPGAAKAMAAALLSRMPAWQQRTPEVSG